MTTRKVSVAEARARTAASMRSILASQNTPATAPLSAGEKFLAATDPRAKSRKAMIAQCGHFPELRGAR